MDTFQDFPQLLWVLITRLDPCHAQPTVLLRNVLFKSVS